LSNLYLDDAIRQWKLETSEAGCLTLSFAENQVLLAESDNKLKTSLYYLNVIIQDYNIQIDTKKLQL